MKILHGLSAPQSQGPVVTARGNLTALRRIGNPADEFGMTNPDMAAFSGFHIPQLYSVITTGECDMIALKRVGDIPYTARSIQDVEAVSCMDVPYPDCAVITASDGQVYRTYGDSG